jgi:hypothetical protein|tara:strand:+ start:63 stop:251 length:189 start_codon:yes stop_codon:yes gene_type:complete
MNTRKTLKAINGLNVEEVKELFNSYINKTEQNINRSKTSLEVLQHATNLNIVLNKDINKFVN